MLERNYDGIFFDFDGVLADTEPLHWQCWSEILAGYGIHLSWEYYARSCVGVSDRDMLDALRRLADRPVALDALLAEYPRKKELFRARVAAESPIPQSTVEFLRGLEGHRLAVVSSSARTEIEPLLDRAGIREMFQVLVCGEDVTRLKPAPDPYLRAAELTGSSRALVVEDSAAGVESARRAGMDWVKVENAAAMPELVRRKLGLITNIMSTMRPAPKSGLP